MKGISVKIKLQGEKKKALQSLGIKHCYDQGTAQKRKSASVHILKERQAGHPLIFTRVLMVIQKHISLGLK